MKKKHKKKFLMLIIFGHIYQDKTPVNSYFIKNGTNKNVKIIFFLKGNKTKYLMWFIPIHDTLPHTQIYNFANLEDFEHDILYPKKQKNAL